MHAHGRPSLLTLLPIILVIIVTSSSHAVDLYATGGWTTLSITSWDLEDAAGSDLQPTYDSALAAISLDVVNTTGPADAWRVEVRRTDSLASTGECRLMVRRTSEGTGMGSVGGGDRFTEVTPVDGMLFDGSGDRTDIELQVRLDGMSIAEDPGMYTTELIFTVIDL